MTARRPKGWNEVTRSVPLDLPVTLFRVRWRFDHWNDTTTTASKHFIRKWAARRFVQKLEREGAHFEVSVADAPVHFVPLKSWDRVAGGARPTRQRHRTVDDRFEVMVRIQRAAPKLLSYREMGEALLPLGFPRSPSAVGRAIGYHRAEWAAVVKEVQVRLAVPPPPSWMQAPAPMAGGAADG